MLILLIINKLKFIYIYNNGKHLERIKIRIIKRNLE